MHIYRCPTIFALEIHMKALRLAAFALIAVAASATSMATVIPLGNFNVPDVKSIGNSFLTAGTYTVLTVDCCRVYVFTVVCRRQ
jgi:hypothetical protein